MAVEVFGRRTSGLFAVGVGVVVRDLGRSHQPDPGVHGPPSKCDPNEGVYTLDSAGPQMAQALQSSAAVADASGKTAEAVCRGIHIHRCGYSWGAPTAIG